MSSSPILPASPVYCTVARARRTITAMCQNRLATGECSFYWFFLPHLKAGGNIIRVATRNTSTTFKAARASASSAHTLHKVPWRYMVEGSSRHCPQVALRTFACTSLSVNGQPHLTSSRARHGSRSLLSRAFVVAGIAAGLESPAKLYVDTLSAWRFPSPGFTCLSGHAARLLGSSKPPWV